MFIKAEENKIYVTKDDEFEAGYASGSFYSELQDTYVYKGIPLSAYWLDEAPEGVNLYTLPKDDTTAPIVLENEDYAAALGSPIEGDVYYAVVLNGTPTNEGVYTLQVEYMNGLELGQYEVQNIELHVVGEVHGGADDNTSIDKDGDSGSEYSEENGIISIQKYEQPYQLYVEAGKNFKANCPIISYNMTSTDNGETEYDGDEVRTYWGKGNVWEEGELDSPYPPNGLISFDVISNEEFNNSDVSTHGEQWCRIGTNEAPVEAINSNTTNWLMIDCTPEEEGVFFLEVGYKSGAAYNQASLEIHVVSLPKIGTVTFPQAKKGQPYSASVSYTGTEPVTWEITSGSLPPGLTLNADTGIISGTAI